MIIGQLDDLINKTLTESTTPLTYKLIGSSNGLIVDSLFPYQAMLYIHAVGVQDRVGFQLCVVCLDVRGMGGMGGKGEGEEKGVRRVPLVYSGMLGRDNVDRLADLNQVEINMQQSPKEDTILAVKISLSYKNKPRSTDTLSLLILDPSQLQKPKLQSLHLLRIKCKDDHILDYMWHPLSYLTLLVLLDNESVEIWNLKERDFMRPFSTFKLKNFKGNYSTAMEIKFTSFAVLAGGAPEEGEGKDEKEEGEERIQFNRYALFLMNAIGDIMSLFPFLPIGCTITRQQYDNIYKSQPQTPQLSLLSLYLTACELEQSQSSEHYQLTSTPPPQSHSRLQKWYTSSPKKSRISQISKISKQQHFYQLRLYPIDERYVLAVQVMHRFAGMCHCVWLGLIVRDVRVGGRSGDGDDRGEVDNVVYEVAEVRNQIQNGDKDWRFVGSDCRTTELGIDRYQSIYYFEKNGLYKLDISSIFKFLETNQLKFLQGENPFPTTLIFQLPANESLASLACDRTLNTVTFIRQTKNKIKFQLQSLDYLNTFSQVDQISRSSAELLAKLNSLKIEAGKKPLTKEQEKNNQLSIGADKLKVYEEKGIEEFKKDYKIYCDNVKNTIDQGMSKLKISYELMRKKLRSFSQFKDKKRLLNSLLEQVEANNTEINRLLFQDPKQSRQPSTGSLAELETSINTMKSLLDTVKGKKLDINPQAEKTMIKEIDQLFERLKFVRVNVEEGRKYKRELEDQAKL